MDQQHILLLPLMCHGHMIPTVEMAKLFASRGVKTTFITSPGLAEPIQKARDSGSDIGIIIIKFPPEGSGLPDHIVSVDQLTSDELVSGFVKALCLIQEPVEKVIQELRPTCLVADMFLTWTVDTAAKFGIPRLVFHGTGYLSLCALDKMKRHKPFKNVSSDSEPFVLPDLPHQLEFVRSQVADFDLMENGNDFSKLIQKTRESDWRSYGVVVNSFYELEPDYADHYRKVLGRKAWNIGPLFLCNDGDEAKAARGKKSLIDGHECLVWLDSKKPNSVVYVCFGSMATFSPSQLHEIAGGLEASGQDFIWVVRKSKNKDENEEWQPHGFVDRTKDRGLIIQGWAPQVMVLDHPAIGAFVTHCGWNSTLEGVCAGVPLVMWPLFAEQFFNEKLVTEVLRIGVPVGSKKWQPMGSEGVPGEALAKAVQLVMAGQSALEMRSRAKYYKEMARKAVEEGGSSYNDLSALIEDLSAYRPPRN
ncbi:Scopoletin glucosyltransferase [Sesamum alatum]|uniref:Glycosyltransferase n=1 Tax=Sesamum alatum TaxID=300844 RepID=A0AAE2CJ91_9LAMI|nr:Scopoletin glucosyltransferase [Sesamum alatum]